MKLRVSSLFFVLLLSVNSWAQTFDIPLVVRHFESPHVMPRAELISQVLPVVIDRYRQIGIRLHLNMPNSLQNRWFPEHMSNPYDMGPLLFRVRRFFLRRPENDIDRLYLAAVGPFIQTDGTRWMLGFARSVCVFGRTHPYAFATVQSVNAFGADRVRHSAVVVTHELAHLMGASHDDSNANIMHSVALTFVDSNPGLGFNSKAISEMRSCLRPFRR